jgi:DNA end-binding protein Ku
MRAIYSGTLRFNLISIGIKLYPSVSENEVRFNFLCENGHKIVYKRYCPVCNKEVDYNNLKKGYYLGKSKGYVVFDKEEIEQLESERNKVIEILGFTDVNNIDYIYFDKTYYVMPQEDYEEPYFLIKELLCLTNKSAIGKITLRNKEKLCLINSYRNGLTLTTLFSKEDIRDINLLMRELKVSVKPLNKEMLEIGKILVEKGKIDFSSTVENYKDGFREMFKQALKQKLENKPISINVEEKVEEAKNLMEALIKSVEMVEKKRVSENARS